MIQLLWCHTQHRFLLIDQAFVHHLYRNVYRRRTRALTVAGLQHVQLLVFDGELEILNIAIMLLQVRCDLTKLIERLRKHFFKLRNRLRRANTGDHIFALRVH